jgi:hypothetical protein
MKIIVTRVEKEQPDGTKKEYFSVDKINKLKLFDMPLTVVFAKLMVSKIKEYGKSAMIIVKLPEEFKPYYINDAGKEVEAKTCTAVSMFLPIKTSKTGLGEYGSGKTVLDLNEKAYQAGVPLKIILTTEQKTRKDGTKYSTFVAKEA